MQPLFPVLLLTAPLFIFARALDDDYVDDNYFLTDGGINSTNEYSEITAQLNCFEFVVRHEGVRIEENYSKPNRLLERLNPASVEENLVKPLHVEDEDNHVDSVENESAEKPIISKPRNGGKKISKRAVVTIERYWTANNVTIIDGYSKVATYPMPDHHSVKRETVTAKAIVKNDTTPCTAPFDDGGEIFNWYEVIVENGGLPGKVNATTLTPNVTEVPEPCHRPITNTLPPLGNLLYDFELIDFEKVYRKEQAFLRFTGTPSEFVDVVGELVWAPDQSVPRYYRVSYRKDDTGFYVNVRRRHKCVFEKYPMTVKCEQVDDYKPCETKVVNRKNWTELFIAGLKSSLIGST